MGAYITSAVRRWTAREARPHNYQARAITGALALTWMDPDRQVIDGGAGDRAVTLPDPEPHHKGCAFTVRNSGTTNALVLNVSLVTLAPGDWAEVYVDDAGAWAVGLLTVAPTA